MKGELKEKDILALYDYLCEYESRIKTKGGTYNIYDEAIVQFKKEQKIFFGSIKNKKDQKKSQKFSNYFLWSEGAIGEKKSNVDRAHALLRRIRNSFAHANIIDDKNGSFKLRDENDKGVTLVGVISYPLLYRLIEELKKTNKEN